MVVSSYIRHSGRRAAAIRNLLFSRMQSKKQIDSRHPWRSPFGPPSAFAFAILQTQSGSTLRVALE